MTFRLASLGFALVALAACNTAPPPGVMGSDPLSDCLVNIQSYASAWACSRGQAGNYNGDVNAFVAHGDALLGQVNRGEVSDADAITQLSNGFNGNRNGGGGTRIGGGGRR